MGQSLYRIEIIKERFVQSNSNDLKILFKFIEDQLSIPVYSESKYVVPLDPMKMARIKINIADIKATELEAILDFTDERIEICRNSDMSDRIIGDLNKDEFFSREEKYTRIEKYILKLKIG